MKLSPDVLMAYADGELDDATRREVDAAIASDPSIASEVARLKAQRDELAGAFSDVLHEPIPPSLLDTARTAPAGLAVADLSQVRAQKNEARAPRWSWPHWVSVAASILIGVLIGRAAFGPDTAAYLVAKDGRIVAEGRLAAALFERLGTSDSNEAGVNIGISFRAKSGEYCRTFATGTREGVAGIACRGPKEWRVQTLAAVPAGTSADYRPAGADLPPAILQAVEAAMDGEALDAEDEAAARARH
jgi:hypothetical protein